MATPEEQERARRILQNRNAQTPREEIEWAESVLEDHLGIGSGPVAPPPAPAAQTQGPGMLTRALGGAVARMPTLASTPIVGPLVTQALAFTQAGTGTPTPVEDTLGSFLASRPREEPTPPVDPLADIPGYEAPPPPMLGDTSAMQQEIRAGATQANTQLDQMLAQLAGEDFEIPDFTDEERENMRKSVLFSAALNALPYFESGVGPGLAALGLGLKLGEASGDEAIRGREDDLRAQRIQLAGMQNEIILQQMANNNQAMVTIAGMQQGDMQAAAQAYEAEVRSRALEAEDNFRRLELRSRLDMPIEAGGRLFKRVGDEYQPWEPDFGNITENIRAGSSGLAAMQSIDLIREVQMGLESGTLDTGTAMVNLAGMAAVMVRPQILAAADRVERSPFGGYHARGTEMDRRAREAAGPIPQDEASMVLWQQAYDAALTRELSRFFAKHPDEMTQALTQSMAMYGTLGIR